GAGRDVSTLLKQISAQDLDGLLRGCSMTLGFHDVNDFEYFEVEVDHVREPQLSHAFQTFRKSMDETIRLDGTSLVMQRDKESFVDVSSILLGAAGGYRLKLGLDAPLSSIRVELVAFDTKGMVRRPCFDGPVDGPFLDCIVPILQPAGGKPFRIL